MCKETGCPQPHQPQKRPIQDQSGKPVGVKKEAAPIPRPKSIIDVEQVSDADDYNAHANGNAEDGEDVVKWLQQDELLEKGMVRQNLFKPEDAAVDKTEDGGREPANGHQRSQAGRTAQCRHDLAGEQQTKQHDHKSLTY